MKKMKLVLLAAMVIGIGSAFTTVAPKTDGPWVKGKDGNPILESEAIEQGGFCDSIYTDFCTFQDESLTTPTVGANVGRYSYPTK